MFYVHRWSSMTGVETPSQRAGAVTPRASWPPTLRKFWMEEDWFPLAAVKPQVRNQLITVFLSGHMISVTVTMEVLGKMWIDKGCHALWKNRKWQQSWTERDDAPYRGTLLVISSLFILRWNTFFALILSLHITTCVCFVCVLPSGGYKGYGLGMMVEVFCGILAGAQYSNKIRTWKVTDRVANLVRPFFLCVCKETLSQSWQKSKMK